MENIRSYEQEDEADYFAICFIAPENIFKKVANKYFNGNTWDVHKIADELGLSYRQTLNRGIELKVWKEIIPN